MTVSLAGIAPEVAALIQQNTLQRVFHDAAFPNLLFRMEATPELWPANIGERQLFTRTGLIPVDLDPLTPGQDPDPAGYDTERWAAVAKQYGRPIDTHMPTSYVSLASLFARNVHTLGLNAGLTLNRLARNRLFKAYLSGEANTVATAAIAATSVRVTTLNGFREQLINGELEPVSAGNTLAVEFPGTTEPANAVTGAIPDDPAVPDGPGTLTLASALTVGLGLRDVVRATTRARRFRVGGGSSVDSITSANVLTLDAIIAAIGRLRESNIGPHSDGYYHVHLPPQGETQLFADNHIQRLFQSLPESHAYQKLSLGTLVSGAFFRNTEDPKPSTVSSTLVSPGALGGARLAPEIGADITNDGGTEIRRTIVTGGGVMMEKYLDESQFISNAGVQGKIGNFSIVNGGVQVMTDRIRMILRAPQDRMQQVVSSAWSWSGDFPIPSDRTNGDSAAFKRAVVIEHGGSPA